MAVSFLNILTTLMSRNRAEILIEKMLSNKLTADELSEFLKSISDKKQEAYYDEILEKYFNQIIESNKNTIATEN